MYNNANQAIPHLKSILADAQAGKGSAAMLLKTHLRKEAERRG